MNRKLVGILVCTLLITTTLPVIGLMNIGQTTKTEPDNPQPKATKTDYLSVPAAAFVSELESYDYHNWGSYLTGNGWFFAPVYLPHEATVTKLTFYWSDTSSGFDASLYLMRYPFGGNKETMAEVNSFGSGGDGFTEDITIDHAVIDNKGYSYFLSVCNLDIWYVFYLNALIEYTYITGGGSGENMDENEQTTQVSQESVYP